MPRGQLRVVPQLLEVEGGEEGGEEGSEEGSDEGSEEDGEEGGEDGGEEGGEDGGEVLPLYCIHFASYCIIKCLFLQELYHKLS